MNIPKGKSKVKRNEKTKKDHYILMWPGFLHIRLGKFWNISLEQFVERKPLIFIEWNCISNIPLFCDFPKYLTNILYYARMVSVTDGVFRLCFGKGKVEYVNEITDIKLSKLKCTSNKLK